MLSESTIQFIRSLSDMFSPLHHSLSNIERAFGESLLNPEQQCYLVICLIHEPEKNVCQSLAERLYLARDELGLEENDYDIDSVVISASSKEDALLKFMYYKASFTVDSVSATPFIVDEIKPSDFPNVKPTAFRYLSQNEWEKDFRDKGWALRDGGYVRTKEDANNASRIFAKSGVLPTFGEVAFTPTQVEHLMSNAV